MTRRRSIAGLVGAAIVGSACSTFTKSELEPYIIRIDSVTAVGAVTSSSLELRFWGAIGPNSCHGFDEILGTRSGATLDITVMGERLTNATCAQVVVLLGPNATYIVNPPIPDPFTVRVRQPDGTTLTRTFRTER